MKSKGLQATMLSMAGVAVMAAILISVNWIGSRAKKRFDLTAERAYTLSDGTRNILKKLDTPVLIRFYCTRGENRMPVFLKNHAQDVEDLLDEYRQASRGQIQIQKLDPEPDSDAEDSAKLDGIEPRSISLTDSFYLGLSVTMLDQKETIPFLEPQAARLLEYEISRAISRVMTTDKPVLGVMSPLPVAGQSSPMMMRGRGGAPPWFFFSELKRAFTVKEIATSVEEIPADVKVLVVIHPKNLAETTQYAIDQFVLRGGKLMAFLDPLSVLDPQAGGGPMGMGGGSSSSMDKLLKGWGLTFQSTQVLADMTYVAQLQGRGRVPTVLALTEAAMNKDDVLTSGMDNMLLAFAGSFSGDAAPGLTKTVLIKSSKDSQFVDPMMAQMSGEQIIKEFAPTGKEEALALRLTGKFKTAFPEGKPKATEPPANPDEKKDEKKDENKEDENKEDAGLKESTAEGAVILIGDCDFVQDQIAIQAMQNPFGGPRMVMPVNANIAFAQGAVEQLAGDSNLIAVRSRASRERPFTVVRKMQADAEAAFRTKIKDLESSLADSQRKLNELQRAKAGEGGQKFILSPEQQAEIANFRKKEAETKKELKDVRKNLRADVEALENRIKWLNIAGIPFLVVLTGVALAVDRRSKKAAR